jgi:glucose-1-phosphate adenylyltransferase
VILPDVDIGKNCRVKRAIIDRGTVLEPGTVIGEDPEADRERGFRITESGITLVTPDMLGQHMHFTR